MLRRFVVLLLLPLSITACGGDNPGDPDAGNNPGFDASASIDGAALDAASHDAASHDAVSYDGTPVIDYDAGLPDSGQSLDIADRLALIDGMTVTELTTDQPGYRLFVLDYIQPADHLAPSGQTFSQQITLLHRDYNAPMVLATTGYHNYFWDYRVEPTRMLQGNQLLVEQRYFGGSRPVPTDWDLLRIWQAAADHHRLVEALRPIYPAAWVSTGASKGGMTSIYHRRFFPDDVDATIAYVAPISFGAPDTRYTAFFDTVGTQACRQAVRDFQRDALERRPALETMAVDYMATTGETYAIIGSPAAAFEDDIAGFEWSFWQYMGDAWCSLIPADTATDQEVFEFLRDYAGIGGASDQAIDLFQPYYVQAYAELGFPSGPSDAHISDLYQYTFQGSVLPDNVTITYDPNAMVDIQDWVSTSASELMLIYGEYDPWTAGAFDLGNATDSHVYTVPLANHGASIAALPQAERDQAMAIIGGWMGVTPQLPASATGDPIAIPEQRRTPPPRWSHLVK